MPPNHITKDFLLPRVTGLTLCLINDASVGNAKGIKGGVIDTKTRTSHISWIPFKKMADMYKDIEKIMKTTNGNHFGFDGMTITEMALYTDYQEGGFYEWHVHNDVNMQHEPPVRKYL